MFNKKKRKKFDVRKKRAKLLKEKAKQIPKEERDVKKKPKTDKEEKLEIRLKKETKLYWIRAITGALSGLIGVSIGLTSWYLFLWMIALWLGLPFVVSFLILGYKYDKEEWNWKNIIKPGIGIYLFLFGILAVIVYTIRILG